MAIKASLLTLGALMLAPTVVSARPEKEAHGSVAGLAGYLLQTDGGEGVFGFGLRGGYTLRQNIYVGGTFMYHLDDVERFYYLGGEGGYDFQLEPVTIRPYVGAGIGHASITLSGTTREIGGTIYGFWFGGTVLFNLNEQWFIGGDFKFPILSFEGADAALLPTLSVTGGLNF